MHNSSSTIGKLSRYLALIVWLVLGSGVAAGAEDYQVAAKRLIHTYYPELSSAQVIVIEDGTLQSPSSFRFSMVLYLPEHNFIVGPKPKCKSPDLYAVFEFRLPGELPSLVMISYPAVDDRLRDFEQLAASHPEWTQEEKTNRLRHAGAKYGPNDRSELLGAIPVKRLEPIFGPIEVLSADFELPEKHAEQDETVDRAGWNLHVKAGRPGEERYFVLLLEPFEGKLTWVNQLISADDAATETPGSR